MEILKELLREEVGFLPEGEGLEALLERGEWLDLPSRYPFIEAGKRNPDFFIVREGIIRVWDMDGDKERTFGFGLPGTIVNSKHSFVMNQPSHYQAETCCPSRLLRLPAADFREFVEKDLSVALFMLHYAYGELYHHELRNSTVHNGSARERLKAIMSKRPMILEKVPQRIIASYLGITSEYFSHLKSEILRGK